MKETITLQERQNLLDAARRINTMVENALDDNDEHAAAIFSKEAAAILLAVCVIDSAKLVDFDNSMPNIT